MELQTIVKKIGTMETVFDDFDERPVDCDFMLPDYLPDIAAVLKCIMKPTVQTHQISGDRIMADGTVVLQVLYLDEERKCVRSFEVSQPFTSAFTVKDMVNGDQVALSTRVNYVNCRATSPRRVDIHGAFSVKLLVQGERAEAVIADVQQERLFARGCEVKYSVPTSYAEKVFSLNEVLELQPGAAAAEMLLRTEAVPQIIDCKVMVGKAVVKGELLLKTVYASDTVAGKMDRTADRIPFSQIIDADGLTETDMCRCTAALLLCEVHPAQNPNGENRLLSVSAKLCVTLRAWRTETGTILTDAYHTAYPLKMTSKRLEPCHLTDVISEQTTIQQALDLPDGDVREIVDLWCDITGVSGRCDESGCYADGHLLVCMVTRDSRECLAYYERPVEFTVAFPQICSRMDASMRLLNTDYSLNSGRLDLKLTAQVDRQCMVSESHLAITEMTADETAPFNAGDDRARCCLKAYFAGEGESLWEIAKNQHISISELCAENHIDSEFLAEDTMLLLPLR